LDIGARTAADEDRVTENGSRRERVSSVRERLCVAALCPAVVLAAGCLVAVAYGYAIVSALKTSVFRGRAAKRECD
jgi:hypothetical protein